MTWKQYSDTVGTLLGLDENRLGMAGYTPAMLRQAVLFLQGKVPQYRIGHEVLYYPNDLVLEGAASRGVKPDGAIIRDVYLCKWDGLDAAGLPKCDRFPAVPHPYSQRFSLVEGMVAVNDELGRFSLDPEGYTFYVYPAVTYGWVLDMFFDGTKFTFQDNEEVPFSEKSALAAAEFIKAKISREVEQNIQLHDSYMKSFQLQLQAVYLEEKEKAELHS